MRRRIFLGGIGVAGVSLALVVGIAPAVGKQATPPHVIQVGCQFTMVIQPPPGSDNVTPPVQQGVENGPVYCPSPKGWGSGVIRAAFNTPVSGDMVARYVQYFDTGSIGGEFDLTPQSSSSFGGSSGFQSQTWRGTFKVWYGTGAFRGAKSTQPGKMSCTSPDQVHLNCTESMTIKNPSAG